MGKEKSEQTDSAKNTPPQIITQEIPVVPNQVRIADLKGSSNHLLSEQEIKQAKENLDKLQQKGKPMRTKARQGNEYIHTVTRLKTEKDEFIDLVIYKDGKVGQGAFGKVRWVQNLDTGEWILLKIVDLKEKNRIARAFLSKEGESLKKVDSKSVGNIIRDEQGKNGYREQILIPMTAVPGIELYKFCCDGKNPTMPMAKWLELAENMIIALQEVHNKGLWHRDIKAENMIYDPVTGKVQMIDFGMGIEHALEANNCDKCGSFHTMAPEIYNNTGAHSEKSEVYQMGITLGEALGLMRENNNGRGKILDKNDFRLNSNTRLPDKKMRDAMIDLLVSMTAPDPSNRITLQQARDKLEVLQKNVIISLNSFKNIAYLDLAEWRDLTTAEKMALKESLTIGFDQVQLIDTKKKACFEDKEILTLRKELQEKGIPVSSEVQCVNSENANNKVNADVLIQKNMEDFKGNNIIVNTFQVTSGVNLPEPQRDNMHRIQAESGKSKKDYKKDVDDALKSRVLTKKEKELITDSLNQEITRLEGKYKSNKIAKNRIKAIETSIQKFSPDLLMTCAEAITELKNLEKEMLSTNKLFYHVELITKGVSINMAESKKTVQAIRTGLDEQNLLDLKLETHRPRLCLPGKT